MLKCNVKIDHGVNYVKQLATSVKFANHLQCQVMISLLLLVSKKKPVKPSQNLVKPDKNLVKNIYQVSCHEYFPKDYTMHLI